MGVREWYQVTVPSGRLTATGPRRSTHSTHLELARAGRQHGDALRLAALGDAEARELKGELEGPRVVLAPAILRVDPAQRHAQQAQPPARLDRVVDVRDHLQDPPAPPRRLGRGRGRAVAAVDAAAAAIGAVPRQDAVVESWRRTVNQLINRVGPLRQPSGPVLCVYNPYTSRACSPLDRGGHRARPTQAAAAAAAAGCRVLLLRAVVVPGALQARPAEEGRHGGQLQRQAD